MKISAIILIALTGTLSFFSFNAIGPFRLLANWRAEMKTQVPRSIDTREYEIYDYTDGKDTLLTIDFLKGEHFWHPQLAIWIEDTKGKYITTLLVTNSTAKGIFYGGRTADNFKDFDHDKSNLTDDTRRVNALPNWAFKRNIKAKDGLMAPHPDEPLVDGISGATPSTNFNFHSGKFDLHGLESFVVKLEVNVAFDQNKYFSEYDFLDDDQFHSGTGLMGQPSLIYEAKVDKKNNTNYYLMDLIGHGHPSGQNGEVNNDLSKITTAKKIAERILVKINW